jgi:isochorismate synthase EntC
VVPDSDPDTEAAEALAKMVPIRTVLSTGEAATGVPGQSGR